MHVARTDYGFVALIFGYEFTYGHFNENIGISWRRLVVIGSRRWYLREDWSVFARSKNGQLKYNLHSQEVM